MATSTRTRGRTPTVAEAQLLTVYQDAEAALLRVVTDETRRVVDATDTGTATARLAGAQRVNAAARTVLGGLERGASARVGAVLDAARDEGATAAVRELGGITGGGRDQYADTVNRGALDRLAAAVLDRLTPAHAAALRNTVDVFRDITARVLPAVLVGADTRRAATQRALWEFADRGITGLTDRAGRRWSLSAYAEMAVRTAAARAATDGRLDRLASIGLDLVIVNSSGDRCDECRPWAGKILTQTGDGARTRQVEHATQDGVMVDVRIAGSVDDARRAGLLHPQCRCSLSAYLPGVTRPMPPAADNGQYEARQRQRAIERQIRGWKAREAAALGPRELQTAARGRAAAQARMRDHMAANPDLRRLRHREAPGAGNAPTARTAGPLPAAVRGEDRLAVARPRTPDELVAHYRDTVGDLPAAERRAVSDYAGGNFVSVNGWLRGNRLAPPRDPASPFAADVRPQVRALESAAKRYQIPEDVRVYRRVNADALPDDLRVGGTLTERGFSSTSLNRASTVEFRGRPVELDIDVPKGHRGVLVEGTGVRAAAGEAELLLPPGKFRVVADEVGADGVRRVKLEAVTAKERARGPRDMKVDELDREMQAALEREDFVAFERFAAETDRREAARDRARGRRVEQAAAREEARAADMDRLLDKGWSDEEAYAKAYGTTVEKMRRQTAIAQLRADGYRGKGFDELSRDSWKDRVYATYDAAERATNGYMVNPAGRAKGVSEAQLLTADEVTVRRYATPELQEWLDQGNRVTLAEHRAELLGDMQGAYRERMAAGDVYQ